MYKNIMVMLDNSSYSLWSLDMAMELAEQFGSTLTGNHVYAAQLHEDRFVQMEPGLPAKYQDPVELQRQRDIHSTLIEKGLSIISNSYLEVFQERCKVKKIPCERKVMEGKNYSKIVEDVAGSSYDLVTMGIRGLGEVDSSRVGSVCERVTRRIRVNALIAKNDAKLAGGTIAVCIDGSEQSYAGMRTAISLAKNMGCKIVALAVFDPAFHYRVFDNIAKVLSEEDSKVFHFEDQKVLHEEIIDTGLERIYRENLEQATAMALRDGLVEGKDFTAKVMAGKAFDVLQTWLQENKPALLILGRVGVHCDNGLDIGSNTEFLLRHAPCNVLLISDRVKPYAGDESEIEEIEWDEDAIEMLNRAPGFVRNLIRGHMEANARKNGTSRITAEMMKESRGKMHL